MQLIINDSVIPLHPGASLSLVMRSPLFLTSENKIPGSYIFNFDAPASPQLRAKFGQAHRVQRDGRAEAELPYLIKDGSLRFAGTCIVKQADQDNYSIACKIDNGDFNGIIYNKTLKDIDLGGDRPLTAHPYAIGTSSEGIDFMQVEDDPFTLENPVTLTDEIIDTTNSLNGNSIYTVPVNGTYVVEFSCNILNFTNNAHLRVYKNNALLDDIALSAVFQQPSTMNNVTASYALLSGDELSFRWYFTSIPYGTAEGTKAIIVVKIDSYYLLNVHTSNALFNDVVAGDQYSFDYAVFPIQNSKFLENFPDDAFMIDNTSIKTLYSVYFTVQNYWKNGEFPFFLSGTKDDEYFVCANLFTPFVYMYTILSKIIGEAGYTIVNNPFDSPDFKGMVLYNAYAENTFNGTLASLVPIKPTFNLSDHVPAMAQNDFLKWVSVLTGFMPVVDNNLLTITFIDMKDRHVVSATNPCIPFPGILQPNPSVKVEPEYKGIKLELKKAGPDKYLDQIKELNDKLVYKGDVATLNSLPVLGNKVNDLYLVTSLNEYYVYQYNPETYSLTWWFYSKKFPILYKEGSEPYLQVSTELCPVLTSRILDETLCAPENRFWILPRTDQPGILEGFPDSLGSEYGQQVLIYIGTSLDSLGNQYPLGTTRWDDYTGNVVFIDVSAESIFENRYKNFLRWLAYTAKPVTLKARLTRGQLKRLQYEQIYSGNGFRFLVKELRVNLTTKGLSLVEMDVYTV